MSSSDRRSIRWGSPGFVIAVVGCVIAAAALVIAIIAVTPGNPAISSASIVSNLGSSSSDNGVPGLISSLLTSVLGSQTTQTQTIIAALTNQTQTITATITACCQTISSNIASLGVTMGGYFSTISNQLTSLLAQGSTQSNQLLFLQQNTPNKTIVDCTSMLNVKLQLPNCGGVSNCTEPVSAVVLSAKYRPENFAIAGRVAFCEVWTLTRNESYSRYELPLPDKWNGWLLAAGGGGFDGSFAGASLNSQNGTTTPFWLNLGYITTATDGGHTTLDGSGGAWGLGHPQRWEDYLRSHRHFHAVIGKQIAFAYYGKPVVKSIHSGCSNGGHAGWMEANMFPEDYDGIVAMSPLRNYTTIIEYFISSVRAFKPNGPTTQPLFHVDNMTTVRAAVLAKCDGIDGLVDGYIADSRLCVFDPLSLTDLPGTAWTAQQRTALKIIYSCVQIDGTSISECLKVYPGYEIGFSGWVPFYTNASGSGQPIDSGSQAGFARGSMRNLFYPGDISDATIGQYMWFTQPQTTAGWSGFNQFVNIGNVDPTNFGAFINKGGKILTMVGQQDPALPASGLIHDYNIMASTFGGINTLRNSARLYMIPEWGHCAGDSAGFDNVGAMIKWLSTGTAPDAIPFIHNSDLGTKQRIMCPEPSRPALVSPTANPNLATSWFCNTTGSPPVVSQDVYVPPTRYPVPVDDSITALYSGKFAAAA